MTQAQIESDIIAKILTGGNRTKAVDVRSVLTEILNSYPNIEDGGYKFSKLVGYSTNITIDDNRAFASKKYVDDAMSSGGKITGTVTAGYLPRIATINIDGTAKSFGDSYIFEYDGYLNISVINPLFAWIDIGTQDDLGTTQLSQRGNQYMISNILNLGGGFYFGGLDGELYMQSFSVPSSTAGIIGITTEGKLYTTTVSGGGTTTNPLTIGTGLSGTSFDGSSAVTIAIDSIVVTLSGSQALSNKTGNISQWTNDSGYLTSVGTVPASSVSAGTFGTGAYVMGTSLSTPSLIGTSGQIAHTSVAQSIGSITDFLFTPSNHTGQTASTNIPVFTIASSTKTLSSGALTTWYGVSSQAQTIAFASASTVTNAFGAFFATPVAGTNATLTSKFSAGFENSIKVGTGNTGLIIRDYTSGNFVGLYNANITPSSTNHSLITNGASTAINAITGGSLTLAYNGATQVTVNASGVTLADAVNYVLNATTGTKWGTATTQKQAWWNATPVVQPASASQAAVTTAVTTTTATNVAPYGYTTQAQADDLITEVGQLKVLVNQLRSDFVTIGLIKGSA